MTEFLKRPVTHYPRWTWGFFQFCSAVKSERLRIGTWDDVANGKRRYLYMPAAITVARRTASDSISHYLIKRRHKKTISRNRKMYLKTTGKK